LLWKLVAKEGVAKKVDCYKILMAAMKVGS